MYRFEVKEMSHRSIRVKAESINKSQLGAATDRTYHDKKNRDKEESGGNWGISGKDNINSPGHVESTATGSTSNTGLPPQQALLVTFREEGSPFWNFGAVRSFQTLSSNVVRPSVRKFDADDKPSIDDRISAKKKLI
ncbi:hypothetical protein NECAME_02644 [Necator americanus]|uniref:Uncharacterized protein n=1 Tax=Necator americanus TaxID=51031 RepID=W2TBU8_NECAM|nr:hypothetical protein NECAME_02644 [Necator americanus]ETN79525.1 hypothetical protein NECAME_02644 [Necator americanus]